MADPLRRHPVINDGLAAPYWAATECDHAAREKGVAPAGATEARVEWRSCLSDEILVEPQIVDGCDVDEATGRQPTTLEERSSDGPGFGFVSKSRYDRPHHIRGNLREARRDDSIDASVYRAFVAIDQGEN